jgi:eukaryotic-like serine/threonine-protein kinase
MIWCFSVAGCMTDFRVSQVSDFGFARELSDGKDGGKTKTEVGPIRWMSPEALLGKDYSEKSDVWAFGCTIIEMIIADVPFYDLSLVDTALRVRDKKVTPLQYHKKTIDSLPVDEYIVALLRKLFPYDPRERPTFAEIVAFLEENAPDDVLKAEERRQKRRQKREKILNAIDEIAL